MIFKLPDNKLIEQVTHIPVAYSTTNIGDDIQSEAASRIFGIRSYVDRDNPNNWPKDSLVPLIGWYSHGYFCKHANVLIIGTHMQEQTMVKVSKDNTIRKWLKHQVKNQEFPALCRDIATRDFLRSLKIDAEFHGCVTTTLKSKEFKRTYFHAIDVSKTEKYSEYRYISNVNSKLPHMTPQERIFEACKRIDLYDQSIKVVTSRLHAYLPCKALGVDVELFTDQITFQPQRFSGYITEEK